MYQLFTLICLLVTIQVQAQKLDSIPPLDSLIQSLQIYHQQQEQAKLAEFEITEKGSWLKYIPGISIGYNLGADANGNLKSVLRPSVSYSTSNLYQIKQDKEIRRAKLESIKQTAAVELANEILQLELAVKRYQHEIEELEFMLRLNEIDSELYEIATVQFNAAEILPSAYLPKKRTYLQKQFEIFQKQKMIRNLATEILLRAKY